jgi:hypothetical protein
MRELHFPSGLFDMQKELFLAKRVMRYRQILAIFVEHEPRMSQNQHSSGKAAINH